MQSLDLMSDGDHVPSDATATLDRIVQASPGLICTGRADGAGADFVNQRFVEYTGLAAARARGWGWMEAVHPVDRPRLTACLESILTSGTSQSTETRLRRADGIYRWFLFEGAPLHDA